MKEIIKKIKLARLKPEERLLTDIFSDLELYNTELINNNFYYKNKNDGELIGMYCVNT